MKILYLGDVMGKPGRDVVRRLLPDLRKKYAPDLVIAQAENVSHGKSMSPHHMKDLQDAGVDFFSGGNHSIERPSLHEALRDPNKPVTAPINQPGVEPGWGAKSVQTPHGKVQVISLLGTIFPNITEPMENPLKAIDAVLEATKDEPFAARVVNFHGDWSSEKWVIGQYLDGRVTAVIGDHWHIPTADAMVLPGGTAHITDVGMCGTLHSSLGVSTHIIVDRWRNGTKNKNDIAETGPFQLNAVLVEVDSKTSLAKSIRQIREIVVQ